MYKVVITCLFALATLTILNAHEGHQHLTDATAAVESIQPSQHESTIKLFGGKPEGWLQWLGGFHFIFLHFPIALITMTALSELLFIWTHKPLYNDAARFMIITAAVFAVPTAIFGLMYRNSGIYEGILAQYVQWHMWLGIATALSAVAVALVRETFGKTKYYYITLFLLLLCVNLTSFIGGLMTFGPNHLVPPG